MDPKAVAVAGFAKGLACSQAVLGAFAGRYGLSAEMAVKISAGFAGGMGRSGGTCGAVTGGIMALGLAFTTDDPDPRLSREPANRKTAEFIRRFSERHGTTSCRELLGCDISTPEGLTCAREKNLFATRCPQFVEDTAELVEQLCCEAQ